MANSSTTVAQLTTLMLSWVDDEQAGYFNAQDTLTWLNFAQREVQKLLILAGEGYYLKPVETTLVVGQADYVFPVDFLKEHKLEIVVSGSGYNEIRQTLNPVTLVESDMLSNNLGTPENYYIKKDRFTVLPTPDTAYLMRMHYSYKIADLALTTDIPDIPEEYMEFVALVAAYNCYIKDDRTAENIVMKINEYKDGLKRMALSRNEDASRHVVMLDNFESIGWF